MLFYIYVYTSDNSIALYIYEKYGKSVRGIHLIFGIGKEVDCISYQPIQSTLQSYICLILLLM